MIGKDDKRGTWYVQIKVKDPVSGKWKAVRKRGFKYKREAQAWETEPKEEHVLPVASTVTFH